MIKLFTTRREELEMPLTNGLPSGGGGTNVGSVGGRQSGS